jgi:hypothetical protein
LGEKYKISHCRVDVLIPYHFSFDAILHWDNCKCVKFCAHHGKNAAETLAMIRHVFGDESMSHAWVFEWRSPNSQRLRKVRWVKNKVKRMLIIFIDFKGVVHKEFVLAG